MHNMLVYCIYSWGGGRLMPIRTKFVINHSCPSPCRILHLQVQGCVIETPKARQFYILAILLPHRGNLGDFYKFLQFTATMIFTIWSLLVHRTAKWAKIFAHWRYILHLYGPLVAKLLIRSKNIFHTPDIVWTSSICWLSLVAIACRTLALWKKVRVSFVCLSRFPRHLTTDHEWSYA